MTMRPRTRIVVVVAAVAAIAVVSLAAYAGRTRLEALPLVRRAAVALGVSSSAPVRAEHPEAPVPSASDANAGGPVSIDPQRQQLIGVRLATVTRSEIAPTIRASGIVRYDETRQADVNVKVDG